MRGVVGAGEKNPPAIRSGNPYNRKGTIIAVTNIMKGRAYHTTRVNFPLFDTSGQPGSMKPKMTPLPSTFSRLHSSPADKYRTEEANMFGNHVIGYDPSLRTRYKSYDQLAENIQTHIAMYVWR
jgi:hypothetical protein